jgi:hypothetical protein
LYVTESGFGQPDGQSYSFSRENKGQSKDCASLTIHSSSFCLHFAARNSIPQVDQKNFFSLAHLLSYDHGQVHAPMVAVLPDLTQTMMPLVLGASNVAFLSRFAGSIGLTARMYASSAQVSSWRSLFHMPDNRLRSLDG